MKKPQAVTQGTIERNQILKNKKKQLFDTEYSQKKDFFKNELYKTQSIITTKTKKDV